MPHSEREGGRRRGRIVTRLDGRGWSLDGREVGRQAPDAVTTVIWRDVEMRPGRNCVELRAGGRAASARWSVRGK